MRVNRNGIVFYGAGRFGQKYREGDKGERLPKLRDFKPDEQSDKAATRGGEESANGALLGIIPQGCQLGGEIERGQEPRRRALRQQTQAPSNHERKAPRQRRLRRTHRYKNGWSAGGDRGRHQIDSSSASLRR